MRCPLPRPQLHPRPHPHPHPLTHHPRRRHRSPSRARFVRRMTPSTRPFRLLAASIKYASNARWGGCARRSATRSSKYSQGACGA
jgi:hypothetical protein